MCLVGHLNHRSAVIEGFGRPFGPECSRLIHGNVIPYDATPVLFSHRVRNQAASIPELRRAEIGNAGECCSGGASPVRHQDRLPHDKNADGLAGKLVQDVFGCRSPLQADRSGGRQ